MFALTVIGAILLFTVFGVDEGESITGYADDIQERDTGYVFYIHDTEGNVTKAFSSAEIDDGLHVFRGNRSSDGSIFFVDSVS